MGAPPADVLVIQNPAAGARHPERLRDRIAAELARRGYRAEVCGTTGAGAARALAARAVDEGIRRVVVAGGDGTISEAAGALLGSEAILGVIPCGTGNQLAYHLDLPLALQPALSTALGDSLRTIDVGWLGGRAFAVMAGAGIDAAAIAGAERRVKRWVGKMAYVASGLWAAVHLPRARLTVRVDGEEWTGEGIGVMVANVPRLRVPLLRGGLVVAPEASAEDGVLDCRVLAVTGAGGLAREAWRGLRGGRGGEGELPYLRGRSVEVEADPPLPVQADGDLAGSTPFRAAVRAGALCVAAPRPVGWRARGRAARSGARPD